MTLSHASVIRLITKFGDHHDKEVIEWRDTLKQLLVDTTVSICHLNCLSKCICCVVSVKCRLRSSHCF